MGPPQLAEARYDGETLTLDIPYRGSAEPGVYLTLQPATLVVDMPMGNPDTSYRLAATGSSRVKLADLTPDRASFRAELPHRVPPSNLVTKVSGGRLHLELKTSYDYEDSFSLTSGLRWKRREFVRDGRYLLWNELVMDPKDSNQAIDIGLARDRLDTRERPSSVGQRSGAIMAVNGGYFAGGGGALGLVFRDGKLLMPQVSHRSARTGFGLTSSGEILMERIVASGSSVQTVGGEAWTGLKVALGAGPRLLRGGHVALTTDDEELGPRGNDITRRAARTVMATHKDGRVSFVTVTGYHDLHREGVRLEEVAGELQRRGFLDAMNFDGGSSTSMSLAGHVVSNGAASPKVEKEVATSVLVKDRRPAFFPASISARCDGGHYPADGQSEIEVTADIKDNYGKPVSDGAVVRVFGERCQLQKDGYRVSGGQVVFRATTVTSVGEGKIRLECGAGRGEVSFNLDCGPAEKLNYRLISGQNGPDYQDFSLVVYATDRQGHPVGNVPITLSGLTVAAAPTESGITGKNGRKTFLVRLPRSGGKLQVQTPGFNPVDVTIGPLQSIPSNLPSVPSGPNRPGEPSSSPTPSQTSDPTPPDP